jgi:hypothetical protein
MYVQMSYCVKPDGSREVFLPDVSLVNALENIFASGYRRLSKKTTEGFSSVPVFIIVELADIDSFL